MDSTTIQAKITPTTGRTLGCAQIAAEPQAPIAAARQKVFPPLNARPTVMTVRKMAHMYPPLAFNPHSTEVGHHKISAAPTVAALTPSHFPRMALTAIAIESQKKKPF